MRRFVVIGQRVVASPDFSLDDMPGTSGRLDVLLRCLRAALLVSHGCRADTVVYLAFLGEPRMPRVLRVEGAHVRFVRPDERSLALLVQKALARRVPRLVPGFSPIREGLAIADGGLEVAIADLGGATPYVLDEAGPDLRERAPVTTDAAFFVGDHLGFGARARAAIDAIGATPVGVGPVSLHADDAITILRNELDRRDAAGGQKKS